MEIALIYLTPNLFNNIEKNKENFPVSLFFMFDVTHHLLFISIDYRLLQLLYKCERWCTLRGTAAIYHELVLRVKRSEFYKVYRVVYRCEVYIGIMWFKGEERKRLKSRGWLIQWRKKVPECISVTHVWAASGCDEDTER